LDCGELRSLRINLLADRGGRRDIVEALIKLPVENCYQYETESGDCQ
jgi:hypothetical protein